MEKQPKFIRDFAKDQSDVAEVEDALTPRQEVTRQVHEKRNEAFGREKTLVENRQELEELADKVAYISENVPRIITNYFKLRKLKAELVSKTSEHQDLAMADAEKQIDGTPEEFMLAEQMLADYQQKMEQEWVEGEYTQEEVETYFTEEYLSSLSKEDYIKLLRRFPASTVTHVTRQGVRDHTGHMYHLAGVGEATDGLKDMLEDGRLRPTLAMNVADQAISHELIENFCSMEPTEEGAIERFHEYESAIRESYADHLAVHFAANEVADVYYGAEKGNEVFVVYPSIMIASRHLFYDEHHKKFNFRPFEPGETARNNIYAWDEEARGFDLNAGVIFIPRSTEVDPNTGSKYLIDAEGKVVKDKDLIDKIALAVASEEFQSLARESRYISKWKDPNVVVDYKENQKRQKVIKEEAIKLISGITGLDAEQTEALIYERGYNFISSPAFYDLEDNGKAITMGMGGPTEWIELSLREMGILYKKPENTVTSEQYWEQYFKDHPEQRPAHIVYYDGDPTKALLRWKKENGIIKENPDEYLGYKDRHVSPSGGEVSPLVDRYVNLALASIHEYYKSQESEIAA